jgi:HEAT repeat protein/CRP-like cAMP-binding protein/ATP/ADP translocase
MLPTKDFPLIKRLGALLEIRPGEGELVFLLVVLSACMGFGRQFAQIASGTLFLAAFDVSSLPYVYIGVAVVVPIVGFVYSRLEPRVSLTRLQALNLISQLAVFAALWIAMFRSVTQAPAYLLAVWYEAAYIMTGLAMWSIAGRLLNVRQAKRLFGLIGAGDVLAATLSGFITPWWVATWDTASLLVGVVGSFALAVGLIIYIMRRFAHLAQATPTEEDDKADATGTRGQASALQRRYAILMVGIMLVSTVALYFVDNIFYAAVEGHFQDDVDALAAFLGMFWAVVNLLTLVLNLAAVGPLTNRFGVRVGLLVLPVALLIISAITAVGGWFNGAAQFIFWLAVINNLLDWVLSETLYKSASLILYQPLPAAQRNQLQTGVESFAQPIAQGLAGFLLIGLGLLSFGAIEQNYVLFILLIAWIGVVLWLGRDYMAVLTQALAKRRLGQGGPVTDPNSIIILRQNLKSPHAGTVIYALDMLADLDVANYLTHLAELITHPTAEVRAEAYRRLEKANARPMAAALKHRITAETDDPSVRGEAIKAWLALADEEAVDEAMIYLNEPEQQVRRGALIGLLKAGSLGGILTAGEQLTRWLHSPQPAERQLAAEVLGEVGNRQFYKPLIELLKDPDLNVRRAALQAAGRVQSPQLWAALFAALATPIHNEAAQALVLSGVAALPQIQATLAEASTPHKIRHRLVRVLGRINHPDSLALLLSYFEADNADLRYSVVLALDRRDYRAKLPAEAQQVQKLVRLEVAQAAWFLAAYADVFQPNAPDQLLAGALIEAVAETRSRLLHLLTFIYSPQTILRVRDSLAMSSVEKRAYAVEALDNLLAQDLKPLLLPLVDELTPEQQLAHLGSLFPQTRLDRAARLQELWEKVDPSFEWLRVCVVHDSGPTVDLGLAEQERKTMLSIIERVLILKTVSLFSNSPDSVVADVASLLEETELPASQRLFEKGDAGNCMYIIVNGKVKVHDGPRFLNYLGERDIVGEMAVLDAAPRVASVTAEEDTLLLRLDQEALYELMADRIEVARGIIRVLTTNLRNRVRDVNDLREQLETAKASANRMQERVWTRLKL